MDFFITATIKILVKLSNLVGGNFGLAIIALTVIVKMLMWSLNYSQQKSMREMQKFQPEMKRIQERYKSDSQMMQQKMMEFYKKHNFNPMSGCFPAMIQMPILFVLYGALISPLFISIAGDSQFLFIKRLDATLKGNTGVSFNGNFQVGRNDTFSVNKGRVNITLLNGDVLENVKVNSKKAVVVMGDIEPGESIDFKIDLDNLEGLKYAQLQQVKSAMVPVVDNATREVENIEFTKDNDILKASVPTIAGQSTFNPDVFFLIILFGLSMFGAQKVMTATQKGNKVDPKQEAMQKMMGSTMPIMFTIIFFIFPIPAGVLLYLVVSNIIQVGQTFVINKQLDALENEKKDLADVDIADAKKVEAKDVKTIENKEK